MPKTKKNNIRKERKPHAKLMRFIALGVIIIVLLAVVLLTVFAAKKQQTIHQGAAFYCGENSYYNFCVYNYQCNRYNCPGGCVWNQTCAYSGKTCCIRH